VLLLAAAVGAQVSWGHEQPQTFYAAVNHTTGGIRMLADPTAPLRKGETLIHWNEAGPNGDTGATGEKGDKGDPGETGLQGEKGDKGDPGVVSARAPLEWDAANGELNLAWRVHVVPLPGALSVPAGWSYDHNREVYGIAHGDFLAVSPPAFSGQIIFAGAWISAPGVVTVRIANLDSWNEATISGGSFVVQWMDLTPQGVD
jgi:hypothetical protein